MGRIGKSNSFVNMQLSRLLKIPYIEILVNDPQNLAQVSKTFSPLLEEYLYYQTDDFEKLQAAIPGFKLHINTCFDSGALDAHLKKILEIVLRTIITEH